MIPNPGQFPANKKSWKDKDHEKHTSLGGLKKHSETEKSDPEYDKFKSDYLKKAPSGRYNGYKAPDGSWHGHPQSESAIKAHYKWSKMTRDQQNAHTERLKNHEKQMTYKPKKDIDDHKNLKRKDPYINKKKGPDNDDDNNKGFGGGAKVPRKPKPSPQSPGEYRPIERKTDPDYARKLDRYRVQAR